MPLPLGHAAIGLATHVIHSKKIFIFTELKTILFIFILSNLPDIDILVGLLFRGNGSAFHRGPTHSILFALLFGLLASRSWKLSPRIPVIGSLTCYMIILSHVVADFFFTNSSVSFFWPFEVNWAMGYSGWSDIVKTIFSQNLREVGIIVACCVVISMTQLVRSYPDGVRAIFTKRFQTMILAKIRVRVTDK